MLNGFMVLCECSTGYTKYVGDPRKVSQMEIATSDSVHICGGWVSCLVWGPGTGYGCVTIVMRCLYVVDCIYGFIYG